MKYKMFSVFDSKVGAYMAPFFVRTTGEAARSFQDAVLNPGPNGQTSVFKNHAEDYTLFEVGSWDDQTAAVDLLPTPHPVCKALEFINTVEA